MEQVARSRRGQFRKKLVSERVASALAFDAGLTPWRVGRVLERDAGQTKELGRIIVIAVPEAAVP